MHPYLTYFEVRLKALVIKPIKFNKHIFRKEKNHFYLRSDLTESAPVKRDVLHHTSMSRAKSRGPQNLTPFQIYSQVD